MREMYTSKSKIYSRKFFECSLKVFPCQKSKHFSDNLKLEYILQYALHYNSLFSIIKISLEIAFIIYQIDFLYTSTIIC